MMKIGKGGKGGKSGKGGKATVGKHKRCPKYEFTLLHCAKLLDFKTI